MKRYILALMALTLILTFSACAKKTGDLGTSLPTDAADGERESNSNKGKTGDDGETAKPNKSKTKSSDPGYAEENPAFGKGRNTEGYKKSDVGNINYDNFLKLEGGMTVEQVQEILATDTVETSDSSGGAYHRFYNDKRELTKITVFFEDGKLKDVDYSDYYRLCVPSADISMAKFKQLSRDMKLDEIKSILGKDFYKQQFMIYSGGRTSELFVWFNDDGQIDVWADTNGDVSMISQGGLSDIPDNRTAYPILTDKQIVDNFSKVEMGVSYEQLEKQFNNFIPLEQSEIYEDGIEDWYSFRRFVDASIYASFYFNNGKLYQKNFYGYPVDLMPAADKDAAEAVTPGMDYDEVKSLIGVDGYMTIESSSGDDSYRRGRKEYVWKLPDINENAYIQITFTEGKIEDDYGIYIYE